MTIPEAVSGLTATGRSRILCMRRGACEAIEIANALLSPVNVTALKRSNLQLHYSRKQRTGHTRPTSDAA
jgi:hypothetical protein